MRVLIPIEVDVKIGNPSLDEVRLWISEIISHGNLNIRHDLEYIPIKKATIDVGEPKEIYHENVMEYVK